VLGELSGLQESDENVRNVHLSIDVETRSTDDGEHELVEREYTFAYSPEIDTWTFFEYEERRTPDTMVMSDRDWRQSRHIYWEDPHETATIDVPPEVSEKLAEATGSDSITIQTPVGTIDEHKYDTFTYEREDHSP
jgi:hypothetical protein